MKLLEYLGVMITMAAYAIIVLGDMQTGFIVGFLGNVVLGLYFVRTGLNALLALQTYFLCANIYGLSAIGAF
jgi:hypothetical protein